MAPSKTPLQTAFAAMERRGVVARHNFMCCKSCGQAGMREEMGPSSMGYCFYHYQDTDSAAYAGQLYLAFGAADDAPGAYAAVGQVVGESCRRAGLAVEWPGDPRMRVLVRLSAADQRFLMGMLEEEGGEEIGF